VVAFINDHREAYGVQSICRVVPIAPSTYHRHRARQRNPTKRSVRAVRDAVLKAIIQRIWREHDQAYGSRRVWKQTERNGLGGTRVSSRPTCGRVRLRDVVHVVPRGHFRGSCPAGTWTVHQLASNDTVTRESCEPVTRRS